MGGGMKIYCLVLCAVLFLLTGCEHESITYTNVPVKDYGFTPQDIPFEENPYYWATPFNYENNASADSNHLRMYFDGVKYHYHPVQNAQDILKALSCYTVLPETHYLDFSRISASTVLAHATRLDGSIYFPYTFDWAIHDTTLVAPWYSGMAQGMMLSAFSRLYKCTGDLAYKAVAD
jgi:hypothetical protein